MKNFYIIPFCLLVFFSCQENDYSKTNDMDAIKETIIQLSDNYMTAWNEQDLDYLMSLATNDGMYLGSDPSEIMDKKAMKEMFIAVFADTTADYSYTIDKRKIQIAKNGKSALVAEYLNMPWAGKLQLRQTFNWIESKEGWKIDCIVWGFIVKNEVVPEMSKKLV